MLQQIENKIEELKQLRAEEYYRKKDEDLKAWGLTTKTDGKKVTPIIVTDDEYEELVKASNGVGKVGRNSVSIFLNALSYIVIVVGVVVGGVLFRFSADLGFVSFSVSVLVSAIIAVIFRGLAEAIRLLQQLIDSKPIERPDIANLRRPEIKRNNRAVQYPQQGGYYAPYPQHPAQPQPQPQVYAYPYPNVPYGQPPQQTPVYAAEKPKAQSEYAPEDLQAFYQNQ